MKEKRGKNMDDIAVLKAAADYLRDRPTVVCDPYPAYDGRVLDALNILPTDTDYLENHEKLENKAVGEMDLEDLSTMYTFIQRGERFCDGHIAGFIEDGSLLDLIDRHIALLEKKNAPRRFPFFFKRKAGKRQ